MKSFTKKLKSVYICAAGVLLSAAFVYMLSVIWVFKVNPLAIIAVSSAVSVYAQFIAKNKNGWLFILFPILIAAIICTYAQFNIISFFDGIFRQVWSYWQEDSEYSAINAYIMTLTAVVPIAVIMYFLHKKYMLRTAMSAIVLVSGITASVIKQEIPKFTAFSAIIYVFLSVIETVILINSRNHDSAQSFNAAAFLFPVAAISVVIAVQLPSSSEPIDWSFLQKIYNAAQQKAEILMTEISYILSKGDSEFSITGYSDSDVSSLGGNISDNDSIIIYVNTPRKTNGNMYLTGSVKNIYNGNNWSSSRTNNSEYPEYTLDYLEFYYALYRNGVVPEDFIYKRNAVLTYNNIKTKTMFYPIKTYEISTSNPKRINFSEASIKYKRAKGEKNTYSFSFLDIDYTSDAFDNFINTTSTINYDTNYSEEDFNHFVGKYMSYASYNYISDFNKDLPAVLKAREKNIYASYLNIPDTVPQRVYDLADKLTKNCKTDYEKMKAIEEYLNTNYYYTKSPGKVPDGKEITDYFLFDSKQGYCTYFATAMAILGRTEGIPTRYVEGTLVDFTRTVKIHTYSVIGNDVHAWTEAYIRGVGWIPFEPTSSYYYKRYAEPQKPVLYTIPANINAQNYAPQKNQPEDNISKANNENGQNNKQALVFIILITLSIFVFSLLYYRIIKYKYFRRYEKADPKYRYRLYFSEILYYLSVLNYSMGQSETAIQFADRISCTFDGNIKAVANTYTKLRFSSASPEKHEYIEATDLLHETEEKVLREKGHIKMLIYKIRLYNI
jgi:transglutaminase-like putative cysteine protease